MIKNSTQYYLYILNQEESTIINFNDELEQLDIQLNEILNKSDLFEPSEEVINKLISII